MAAVNVGIITSHDTNPPSTSTAIATKLAGWTTDHTYTVTYYKGGQMATALANEDILIVDARAIGDDPPSGGSSYYDPGVADQGVPVLIVGWNGGDYGQPTELATAWGWEYQESGACVMPTPLDGEGIGAAAGFSAGADFTYTSDGFASLLSGTLAAGLEVIVESDGGDVAACVLPDGATKQGGGAISGSLAHCSPEDWGASHANGDAVNEQIVKYLADEAVGGGPTPVSRSFDCAAEHGGAESAVFVGSAEHTFGQDVPLAMPSEHLATVTASSSAVAEHQATVAATFAQVAEHHSTTDASRAFAGSAEHIATVAAASSHVAEQLGTVTVTVSAPAEHGAAAATSHPAVAEHVATVAAAFAQVAEHYAEGSVSRGFAGSAEHLATTTVPHAAAAEHGAAVTRSLPAVAEHGTTVAATFAQAAEHTSEGAVARTFQGRAEQLALVVASVSGAGEHVAPVSTSTGHAAEHLAAVEALLAQVAENYAEGSVSRTFVEPAEHNALAMRVHAAADEHLALVNAPFSVSAEHTATYVLRDPAPQNVVPAERHTRYIPARREQ